MITAITASLESLFPTEGPIISLLITLGGFSLKAFLTVCLILAVYAFKSFATALVWIIISFLPLIFTNFTSLNPAGMRAFLTEAIETLCLKAISIESPPVKSIPILAVPAIIAIISTKPNITRIDDKTNEYFLFAIKL